MKPGSRVLVALLTMMLWSLCTLSVPSIAEEQSEHIVVTATRSPVEKNQLGGSVTIISRAEIELYQYRYLSSVLQAIPGLYVASSGGMGAQTSLFSRGSESNHTLILIDGIEVTDPALGGVFALENFQLHGVERIEILRGPYSARLGSEAIGGVINIITRKRSGSKEASASLEYGSYNTKRIATQLANHGELHDQAWDVSLAASYFDTNGESHTAERLRATQDEDDGHENIDYKLNIGADLTPSLRLQFHHSASYSENEYDSAVAPFENHTLSQDKDEERWSVKLEYHQGVWQTQLQALNVNINTQQQDSSSSDGSRKQLGWHNDFFLNSALHFTFGLEAEYEKINTQGFVALNKRTHNQAGYMGARLMPTEDLSLSINLRHDNPAGTDNETSAQVLASWLIPQTPIALNVSYGTAFKVPTLSDRFGFGGNLFLQPENSRTWEFGIQSAPSELTSEGLASLQWGLVYFNNDIRDLISYDFVSQKLRNIEQAEIEGIEFSASLSPLPTLSIGVNYTLLSAENQDRQRLLRRPVRQANMNIAWRYGQQDTVALRINHIGERQDIDRTTFARTAEGGYTLFDLTLNHQISERFSGFVRAENLFDADYEPVNGYHGQSFSIYMGVSTDFD